MEDLGFKFWGWLAGMLILGGIALLVLLWIFYKSTVAWGFFGAFIALALVLLAIGWIYDRRQQRKYETE
jgi:hypothetical protein